MKGVTIMYIVPSLNSGGVERNVAEVANHLVSQDANIYILTSEAKMRNLFDSRVNIVYANVKSKNPLVIFLNIFLIRNICRRFSVDILHPKSRAPAWSAYLAVKRLPSTKLVTTFHGMYSCYTFLEYYYSKVMSFGKKVVAVSEFIGLHILDNYPIQNQDLNIINRGIDCNFYSPDNVTNARLIQMAKYLGLQDNTQRVLLFPGRLSHIKGQEVLVESLAKIQNRNFLCLIVGDSAKNIKLRDRLVSKIIKYSLQENVRLINNIDDMQSAYLLSHAVLCLSLKPEAFGRVPIEAAAMGRPCVVTNIGALKYNVIDKKTGWIIEPGSVEDLQNTIEEVVNMSQEEWLRMCEEAQTYARKYFGIERMLESTKKVYKDLLK
jgi:glycosyltransferase involved in cell wall biosynthesis